MKRIVSFFPLSIPSNSVMYHLRTKSWKTPPEPVCTYGQNGLSSLSVSDVWAHTKLFNTVVGSGLLHPGQHTHACMYVVPGSSFWTVQI